MNKAELISAVAADSGESKATVERVLNSKLGVIQNSVAGGDSVVLTGFGTFSQVQRAAREGRNPQTGASIKIAAKKVVKFKAGKVFSDQVK
jgi:DNA-binding protein HU-beta